MDVVCASGILRIACRYIIHGMILICFSLVQYAMVDITLVMQWLVDYFHYFSVQVCPIKLVSDSR